MKVDNAETVYTFSKGDKKPVDEKAPKKPLTAFFRWANENREAVRADNPDAKITEITKIMGEKWKNLKPSEKKVHEDAAKEEKATWERLMAAYKHTSNYKDHQEKLHQYNVFLTKKPFKKDPNAPKRAMTSYMLFVNEERPKIVEANPDAKVTEILKLVGAAWSKLTDAEKKPWAAKAAKAKEAHAAELAEYQKSELHQQYLKEKEEYLSEMKDKRKRLAKNKRKVGAIEPEESPAKKKAKQAAKPKKPSSEKKKDNKEKKKAKGGSSKAKKVSAAKNRGSRSGSSSSRKRSRSNSAKKRSRSSSRKRAAKANKSGNKSKASKARKASEPKKAKKGSKR